MSSQQSFKKSLNLFDSTALVVGSMIGSGIFIVSADMSRQLGSPGWMLITWIITGIITIIAALSYGELAAMFPGAGGQYVYLRQAFNPLTAFLYGWTLFLVIQGGSIAAIAVAFGKFVGVIFPWISENNILFQYGRFKINTVHLPAIFSIIFLTYINSRGIEEGKKVQNIFTFLKVGVLVLFIILGFAIGRNSTAIHLNIQNFWNAQRFENGQIVVLSGLTLITAIAVASVGSIFSADAWNSITFTAGEVINARKNVGLSLFLGSCIVIGIYLMVNVVYLFALPLRGSEQGLTTITRGIQFATNDRVATAAISGFLGNYAAIAMALLIMVSTFGCNNGIILSGARVYHTMANDGLFFRKVGKLNKNQVPGPGLWVQCIWSCLLCLSGTYGNLLDYVIFTVLIFYVLTIAGIFILRRKMPNIERPYKAFGYPIIPLVYIVTAIFIMGILLIYKPDYTFPGLYIVLLGIPVYFVWKKVNKGETKTI